MLKKIVLILSTLILITGCEYKPIYSDSNKSEYRIIITKLSGDKKINKFILNNLQRNSQKDSNKIVNIKIDTKYTKVILAKNSAGNVTDYQSNALVTFLIDRNQTSKSFTINEKFNFQKMSDKYEEKAYEENIKKNLATAIAQKLILRLSITQ
tara:strand:- start:1834 stop:2292 length:459 start_codon:yes stop_codon:yes gene_type:complete